MRAGWTPATPKLLLALERLKVEARRAQDRVQVGAPLGNDLRRAVGQVYLTAQEVEASR